MSANKENRVWIELERSTKPSDNHHRADLASKMLKRLGVDLNKAVWFNENKNRYCFKTSSLGSYVDAPDNGFWYDLDFLANSEI